MGNIDSYTKLLLHCDGADGSTTFIDSSPSGKSVTANGNAQIDTAQYKFGGASALFDGTGDYLSLADSADWAFGSGDFTIDFWVRFNTFPSEGNRAMLYTQYVDSSNRIQFTVGLNSGIKQILFEAVASSISISSGWVTITMNTATWYHIALVRNGNNFNIYQDGTSIKQITDTDAMPDIATTLVIGDWAGNAGYCLNGWIDEYRISKGIARWTANFTPPTRPYSRSQAAFLLNMI